MHGRQNKKKVFCHLLHAYTVQRHIVMLTSTYRWIIHYASLIHYAPYSLFIEGPVILPAMPSSRQQKCTRKCSMRRPSYSLSFKQPNNIT